MRFLLLNQFVCAPAGAARRDAVGQPPKVADA
jgi:hypothetical protein